MSKENEKNKNRCCKSKAHTKPCDIKGKLEIRDTRPRKDGPGGN